jgi:hypothetical protein
MNALERLEVKLTRTHVKASLQKRHGKIVPVVGYLREGRTAHPAAAGVTESKQRTIADEMADPPWGDRKPSLAQAHAFNKKMTEKFGAQWIDFRAAVVTWQAGPDVYEDAGDNRFITGQMPWQTNVDLIQAQAHEFLVDGKESPDAWGQIEDYDVHAKRARILLDAIEDSPPAPRLFRGAVASPSHPKESFKPGGSFDLPLASWTTKPDFAEKFGDTEAQQFGADTELVIHLEPGSTAVSLDGAYPNEDEIEARNFVSEDESIKQLHAAREYLGSGHYVIDQVDDMGTVLHVHVHQAGPAYHGQVQGQQQMKLSGERMIRHG